MWVKVLDLDEQPDSTGEIIKADGIGLPPAEDLVPVRYNFSETLPDLLGYAKLERRADGIYARLEILDLSKVSPKLYPAICGVVTQRQGDVIAKCEIRSIGLSPSRNADHRILPIGEQTE